MKTTIKTLVASILLLATTSVCHASPHIDSAKILRCTNSKTGEIECLGEVKYYVSRDTLFMSRQFSTFSVVYSDNKTDKMILKQESFYVKNKRHGWWYVIIKKSPEAPKDAYVSMIVLRNCKDVSEQENHICWDAHLYNISKECVRSKTVGVPTKSVQQILKLL